MIKQASCNSMGGAISWTANTDFPYHITWQITVFNNLWLTILTQHEELKGKLLARWLVEIPSFSILLFLDPQNDISTNKDVRS